MKLLRRLAIVLVLLVGLLVAADRIGVVVAQGVVADKLRSNAMLTTEPSVKITGFPFLTQAAGGEYSRIDLRADDIDRGGVRLAYLAVQLKGVQLPLSDAVSGDVSSLPIRQTDGTTLATFADIATSSGLTRVTVQPDGNLAKVTGHLMVLDQDLTASTSSTVTLKGTKLVFTAQKIAVLGQDSGVVDRLLAGKLDFSIELGTFPYGLQLTGVTVTPKGALITAHTGPTVLQLGG